MTTLYSNLWKVETNKFTIVFPSPSISYKHINLVLTLGFTS